MGEFEFTALVSGDFLLDKIASNCICGWMILYLLALENSHSWFPFHCGGYKQQLAMRFCLIDVWLAFLLVEAVLNRYIVII